MRRILIGMLAVVAAAAVAQRPEPTADPSAAIERLRTEWARNLQAKNIDATVAAYAPGGEFLQPDGSSVKGTTALHALYATVTAAYDSDLVFESSRVEASGDLAYDSGTYRESLTTRATGKTMQAHGTYLTIYTRDAHGQWLIVEQMWTSAGEPGH